jgi:hypothetical protein
VCFITAGPITKLFAWGRSEYYIKGLGHLLWHVASGVGKPICGITDTKPITC